MSDSPAKPPARAPRWLNPMHWLDMPLLTRELTSQANAKRTYYTRVGFAVLFLLIVFSMLLGQGIRLGQGRGFFQFVVGVLFVGIYLLQPALMCAAIVGEKQRNTLVLTMLTDLPAWQVLLQKFVGRMIPMLSVLLIGMPMMAVAYAYGGVDTMALLLAIVFLFSAVLQAAAWTLLWSACCRTVVSALLTSYIVPIAGWIVIGTASAILHGLGFRGAVQGLGEVFTSLLPFAAYISASWQTTEDVFISLALQLGSTVVLLGVARWLFVRAAFAPPHAKKTQRTRRPAPDGSSSDTGSAGGVLATASSNLPDTHPVYWYERHRHSGLTGYITHSGLVVSGPLLLAMFIGFTRVDAIDGLRVGIAIGWPIIALILTARSANTFTSERSNQTLDVLLTTPISASRILYDKQRAHRPMMLSLVGTLGLLYLGLVILQPTADKWTADGWPWTSQTQLAVYSLATLLVYPFTGMWLAQTIGLRVKSTTAASVTALAVVFAWVLGIPILMLIMGSVLFPRGGSDEFALVLFSPFPVTGLFIGLGGWNRADPEWLPAFAAYFGLLVNVGLGLGLRTYCMFNADRLLGRVAGTQQADDDEPQPTATSTSDPE